MGRKEKFAAKRGNIYITYIIGKIIEKIKPQRKISQTIGNKSKATTYPSWPKFTFVMFSFWITPHSS